MFLLLQYQVANAIFYWLGAFSHLYECSIWVMGKRYNL